MWCLSGEAIIEVGVLAKELLNSEKGIECIDLAAAVDDGCEFKNCFGKLLPVRHRECVYGKMLWEILIATSSVD